MHSYPVSKLWSITTVFLCFVFLIPGWLGAESDSESVAELQKYIGSYDTDALLNEPAIQEKFNELLGADKDHLIRNLDVRGAVDLLSGSLSLVGNAVHGGGIEEAVLCVSIYDNTVNAAIFSEGRITIYSESPDYDSQSLCIKDWITQVNSLHQDRFKAPSNVQFAGM